MKKSWLLIVLAAGSVFLAGTNSAMADDRDRHDRDHRVYRSDGRAERQRDLERQREQRRRLEQRRRRAELRRARRDSARRHSGKPFAYIGGADAARHHSRDGSHR